MRKGEGFSKDPSSGRSAMGSFTKTDSVSGSRNGVGNGFHCRPIGGIGRKSVKDLDSVVKRAKAQYKADRRAMILQGSAT